MNILILNGSPKGKNSVSLQTTRYLAKRYPKYEFKEIHVSQKIKKIEKERLAVRKLLGEADLILFVYPVYTCLVPFQLQRFIELIKEDNINLEGKYVGQITTSKHFFDMTAHKYVEENCYDLGMRYLGGFSSDMEDILSERGRAQAESYFKKLIFDMKQGIYMSFAYEEYIKNDVYQVSLSDVEHSSEKDIVIVTNASKEDTNLKNMIQDFQNACLYSTRVVNIREYKFGGGCIGCLNCNTNGECIYRDGFDDFLRNTIQIADGIVTAFTIENHYTHSSLKCYDDRQFCNGHRLVTHGMPVGYIIAGPYQRENNIKILVEGRSEVGGLYLAGVATDELDTQQSIANLAKSLEYCLEHPMDKPKNFYGAGGTKIFRDLVYLMQGIMRRDHEFYKQHGIYDFPHKKQLKILQMKLIGFVMNVPSVQKKIKGQMNKIILTPYEKMIDETIPSEE